MKAACWKLEVSNNVSTYSARSWCATSDGVDPANSGEMFNPLMQYVTNPTSYVALAAGLATAKGTPAFGETNSVAITAAQRKARA